MKRVKQICTILAGAVLAACMLAACAAPLPDGMTQAQVEGLAADTVALVAAGDWESLMDTADSQMADALEQSGGAQGLADVWTATLGQTGEFEEIASTTVGGKDGYAVAVVQAKFAEKTVTFTLSYNADGQLAGLFFK